MRPIMELSCLSKIKSIKFKKTKEISFRIYISKVIKLKRSFWINWKQRMKLHLQSFLISIINIHGLSLAQHQSLLQYQKGSMTRKRSNNITNWELLLTRKVLALEFLRRLLLLSLERSISNCIQQVFWTKKSFGDSRLEIKHGLPSRNGRTKPNLILTK